MVKIWKWYRQYVKEMVVVFLISLILMVTSIVTPLLTRSLIDEGLYGKKWHIILYIIAFLIIIELTVSCLTYLQEKISTKIKSNIEYFLNNEVFLHSLKIKYKSYLYEKPNLIFHHEIIIHHLPKYKNILKSYLNILLK